MLKVLSNIFCDLDPKVKAIGQKAGICDGVPSTSALVSNSKHVSVALLSHQFITWTMSKHYVPCCSSDLGSY